MEKDFRKLALDQKTRFLLVRPDKLGDVISAIPALQRLREAYPQSYIAMLVSEYTAPLLENNPWLNQIISLKGSFFPLVDQIRREKFDVSIHFYVEWSTVFSVRLANVPIRVGPFSKLPALLLNRRLRQNRSQSLKHEADYNLELTALCGASPTPTPPRLFLQEKEVSGGKQVLKQLGIAETSKKIILHPGSAGSAQDWPVDHFINLAKRIAKETGEVIITAGRQEEGIIERFKELNLPRIHLIPAGSLTLRQLAGVIKAADFFVSNSTGPLHIAVGLGVPTLSFYPSAPLVMSAQRWGPYGDPKRNIVLSPNLLGLPMSAISVEQAFTQLSSLR